MRITVPELPWHNILPSSDLFHNLDIRNAYDSLTLSDRKILGLWLAGWTQEEIAEKIGTYQQDVSRKLATIFIEMSKMGLDTYVLSEGSHGKLLHMR